MQKLYLALTPPSPMRAHIAPTTLRPRHRETESSILGRAAAAVNLLCVLNASLGVNAAMALIYLFVRPFSAALVRKLVRNKQKIIYISLVLCSALVRSGSVRFGLITVYPVWFGSV